MNRTELVIKELRVRMTSKDSVNIFANGLRPFEEESSRANCTYKL